MLNFNICWECDTQWATAIGILMLIRMAHSELAKNLALLKHSTKKEGLTVACKGQVVPGL